MNKKDIYTSYTSTINDSHRNQITAMKWFPKGYSLQKQSLIFNGSNETNLLATLAEDGQILIWDLKAFDGNPKTEVSNLLKPQIRIDVYKTECML